MVWPDGDRLVLLGIETCCDSTNTEVRVGFLSSIVWSREDLVLPDSQDNLEMGSSNEFVGEETRFSNEDFCTKVLYNKHSAQVEVNPVITHGSLKDKIRGSLTRDLKSSIVGSIGCDRAWTVGNVQAASCVSINDVKLRPRIDDRHNLSTLIVCK